MEEFYIPFVEVYPFVLLLLTYAVIECWTQCDNVEVGSQTLCPGLQSLGPQIIYD